MRAALHVRGEPPSRPSGQPWGLGGGTAQTRFHVRHFLLYFLGQWIQFIDKQLNNTNLKIY